MHLVGKEERDVANPSRKAQDGLSNKEQSGPSASGREAEKLSPSQVWREDP